MIYFPKDKLSIQGKGSLVFSTSVQVLGSCLCNRSSSMIFFLMPIYFTKREAIAFCFSGFSNISSYLISSLATSFVFTSSIITGHCNIFFWSSMCLSHSGHKSSPSLYLFLKLFLHSTDLERNEYSVLTSSFVNNGLIRYFWVSSFENWTSLTLECVCCLLLRNLKAAILIFCFILDLNASIPHPIMFD